MIPLPAPKTCLVILNLYGDVRLILCGSTITKQKQKRKGNILVREILGRLVGVWAVWGRLSPARLGSAWLGPARSLAAQALSQHGLHHLVGLVEILSTQAACHWMTKKILDVH